jgi:hypothetical protein
MRSHVKWALCHHGISRPQVAERGDCLQLRICSISSRGQPTDVVLQIGGWAWGYKLLTVKTNFVTKYQHGLQMDSLDKRLE